MGVQKGLELLMSKGIPGRFPRKEFLISQGEVSHRVYFIREGVVRHFVITREGKEKTIRISRENDFFYSSIVSYFSNEPSYIYCQCLTDCELLFWEKSALDLLYSKHPEMQAFRNQAHLNFILEKHRKEIALLTMNAEERLDAFCEKNLALFNRIPHHIIASYLDITPETLSRLRNRKS